MTIVKRQEFARIGLAGVAAAMIVQTSRVMRQPKSIHCAAVGLLNILSSLLRPQCWYSIVLGVGIDFNFGNK
jgi:hypothetical protein